MSKILVFHTPDMSCNHCVMAIQRTLAQVPGITDVRVDLPTKSVHLTVVDDPAADRAKAALAEAGYPVSE